MNRWHQQRGMTAIGWMLVLGLIAFFALITLRLVPLYLEYAKVVSTLESLQGEAGITRKSKSEILSLLGKRFDINDVRYVDHRTTKITNEKGILKISIAYERREHLVGNIDIVANFDKEIQVVAN